MGAADVSEEEAGAHWQRRVVDRSLNGAQRRSIDRGARLIRAAAKVLERNRGESLTVQEVADEAGQSLRTLYQYFASKDDLLLAVFEEAMRTYARMISAAIEDLEDPMERLAGGLIASARMPALHGKAGVDRGLSHLRLQLASASPELIARSQEPVTAVFRDLVRAALEAAPGPDRLGVDEATYFVAALRASFLVSFTLGNDVGGDLPDVVDFSSFCLGGIGLPKPRDWHEEVDARLRLSGADAPSIFRRLAKG